MGISVVYCSSRSNLNVKLDVENTRIAKYHEVTNMAM